MTWIRDGKPPTSCGDCLAWGVFGGRYCPACANFRQRFPRGTCAGCARLLPVKRGYCRLCWKQATLETAGRWAPAIQPFLEAVRHHQLFLASLHHSVPVPAGRRLGKNSRNAPGLTSPAENPGRAVAWVQLRLIDLPRDFTRFDRHNADLTNPLLVDARRRARAMGEARGWTRRVHTDVDRALVILLSGLAPGEKVRYSDMFPALQARWISVERTVQALDHLGLLDDDRQSTFDAYLEHKLDGITPGIRRDVEDWIRTLYAGGPRTRAHSKNTAYGYLNEIKPTLLDWSTRFHHLREITGDDIQKVISSVHGNKRDHTIVVLRSLFDHCKKTGTIFRNPVARLRAGRKHYNLILPLHPERVSMVLDAATSPAARLVVVLAGIHAARNKTTRHVQLDDVDLGNRRLVIADINRPLDDLTYHAVLDWLAYRRDRWPNTANPHLIVNGQTALGHGPVSDSWLSLIVRGLPVTLEQLRVDRQLDEALTHGPDPLHLAAVFGLDQNTAMRYANAARHLLESLAERHTPDGSAGTQGSTTGPSTDRPASSR
ncbi:hypothetical protein Franean1_3447 [Parafrankia sp. EAN1pec]|nr:hypothetical protein Franean1_3447 [Frankia sp. EAN1pec]